jgi:hypothetical protein
MQAHAMVPGQAHHLAPGPFNHSHYSVKQSFWSFLGRVTRVFTPDGMMVAYIKRPLLKWKEEQIIFADEGQTQPLLRIKARQAIAINLIRDVFDANTGELVGSIKARGLKSIIRDTWDILDAREQPVGLMQEDGMALLRRFFPILLGKWHIELGGQPVAYIKQVFRFFAKEYTLDMSHNQGRMDARFAMALAVLALQAESRREQNG